MIDPAKLDYAIAAHAKWKSRLREAIRSGQSDWTPEAVRLDDRCEFGQWLNDLPLSDQMSSDLRLVRELHARFHQAAADVLSHALTGRALEATACMQPGGTFSDLSTRLVRALTDWRKQCD